MVGLLAFGLAGLVALGSTEQAQPELHRGLQRRNDYRVIKEMTHDPRAFTQGLVFVDGVFYEGTGLYGSSTLRKVNPESGAVLSQVRLPGNLFGEGIVLVDNKIVQLTWREKQALVYDADSFKQTGKFTYNTVTGEGWGATTDGKEIIVSDGSEWLFFWDKNDYHETRRIRVLDGFDHPVTNLNELEYAEGYIWSNVWMSDDIVQIDPATGKVLAFYDFSGLYPASNRRSMDDVLNGIAYDNANKVFYLTGKRWPKMYKVALCGLPATASACASQP